MIYKESRPLQTIQYFYGDPLCEDVSAIYMINHYHLLVMILDIHPD